MLLEWISDGAFVVANELDFLNTNWKFPYELFVNLTKQPSHKLIVKSHKSKDKSWKLKVKSQKTKVESQKLKANSWKSKVKDKRWK